MAAQYNLRNPAVKRLMKEAQELREPTEQYHAQPLEDNLFEWHFTIRGPADSEFHGGLYHGRIILPPEYPMKPPSIMILTPNGRFEIFKKICLSISGHHPESWQPSWSIRTALLAIIGFMPTHGNGAIGSLDYTADERKVLAKKSSDWKCSECGSIKMILKPVTEASKETAQEAKELASQINFQSEKEKNAAKKKEEEKSTAAGAAASPAPSTDSSTSDAAGAASSSQTAPGLSGFPPFTSSYPGAMSSANMNMPPFMSPMMTPPGSPPAPGAMPRFMPPFWPGMMPPMPNPTSGQGTRPGMPAMNQWPMMPPMMMYPQMMAMMAQQQQQQQQAATATLDPSFRVPPSTGPSTSSPTQSASSDSNAPNTTTTSTSSPQTSSASTSLSTPSPPASSSSSTSQLPTATSSASTPSPTTRTTPSNSSAPTSTSPAPTSTNPAPTSTSPAPTSTSPAPTSSGLRQRAAPAGSPDTESSRGSSSPRPTTSSPPSAIPTTTGQASVRRGENPFMIMAMAVLGLAIVALLLRRLYNVWDTGAFDEF